jgi:predicted DCC family thiol-disulfide oxidoreductase YuxK
MLKLTNPRHMFGIDLRSLALFRVSIGSMLIIDLMVRLSDLRAHYTDWGVLPRDVVIENAPSFWGFSIHLMNGSLAFQVLFFFIQLTFAFFLLVGYRTRFAAVISWILLASLHSLNPMVLSGADDTLRMVMFWGMFLPLGAKFSIDRALSNGVDAAPDLHISTGSVALLVQVSVIYLFAFLFKIHPVWIGEYSALYYMFSLDVFANGFATFLLDFPNVLKFVTALSMWFELGGVILVWLPIFTVQARLLFILTMISLQVGIASTMGIGIFPFVSIAAILIFVPGAAWDWLFGRLRTPSRTGIRIYFDGGCDFCRKVIGLLSTFVLIPGTPVAPADEDPDILLVLEAKNSWVIVDHNQRTHLRFEALVYVIRQSPIFFPVAWLLRIPPAPRLGEKIYKIVAARRPALSSLLNAFRWKPISTHIPVWQQFLAGLFLVYVIFYNISVYDRSNWKITENIDLVTQIQDFAAIGLYQNWKLFAPYPMTDDGWYVIPGKLADGQTVDLWRKGSDVSWDKPSEVRRDYKNNRWVKYMRNIWLAHNAHLRVYYGRYLCRDWNSNHDGSQELRTFSIVYMMEETLPNYAKPKVERFDIWSHDCFAKGPITARS